MEFKSLYCILKNKAIIEQSKYPKKIKIPFTPKEKLMLNINETIDVINNNKNRQIKVM